MAPSPRGTLALRRERLELSSAIHQALDSCQPMIDRAEQRLSLVLPAESLYLDADPVRLAQILSNVVRNASKFIRRSKRTAEAWGSDSHW